ncbi:hypothetical protein GA0116948_11136 [Chitinophaga costaii]|uniref:Uncharacterized protein n=2 Tax=Chitinophaga costaii TaxID=1335309 RepID=A0A1C4F204_9BACT|nr:hypothetical protein GA0116948_11136 [Chitinophaga costaii]
MPQQHIALLELGGSHTECLYAQVLFLQQQGYAVHMICNAHLWPSLAYIPGLAGHQLHTVKSCAANHLGIWWQLRGYLRRFNIRTIVVNTAENSLVRDLTVLPLPVRRWVGIVHNGRKFNRGFTLRRIIFRKIRRCFVLNDTLLQHVQPPRGMHVGCFYPVFFPPMPVPPLEKPVGEVWICIPGSVMPSRRDYGSLLAQVAKHGLPVYMKLIFLGKYDANSYPELAARLQSLPCAGQVVTFKEAVSEPLFQAYLAQSDVILPLLHPGGHLFEQYIRTRISGAYNLAFAWKIPLLMERSFGQWEDFARHAVLYAVHDLLETLLALAGNPTERAARKAALEADPKFSFAVQCQRYMKLLQ